MMILEFNDTITNSIRILPPSDYLKHHKFLALEKATPAFHFWNTSYMKCKKDRKFTLTKVNEVLVLKHWTENKQGSSG